MLTFGILYCSILISFAELLLRSVKTNVKKKIPTIVFCNKTSTCQFVSLFLQECGIETVALFGDMPEKVIDCKNFP